MTLLSEEISGFEVWEGSIGEMGADIAPDLLVPENFMATVKSVDDDPLFVTVEVESGVSKNGRHWKPEHLQQVINKVNDERMAGNLGHPLLDQKEHESGFPLPQVAWIVAKGTTVGDKMRAVFKGYLLKRSEARELLKLGLIDGVSIFGDSRMKPRTGGGYDILSFSPETIDFARKGRQGMKSRVVALTGEQETTKGGTVEAKDIAALSVDEIKTHAPLVYEKIQSDATEPLNTKIGEMTSEVAVLTPQVDVLGELKKLLKLEEGENPVEKLTSLIEKLESVGREDVKAFVNELVGKRVKTERGQALLRRLIGEMEKDYDGALDDTLKKQITDDFNSKIEDDAQIKELVGEMQTDDDDGKGDNKNGGTGGAALGGRSRLGTEHTGTSAKGESKRGGLTIKTRKFSEVS